MNAKRTSFSFLFLLLHAFPALAAVHYIDANSAAPLSPYNSWASAANNTDPTNPLSFLQLLKPVVSSNSVTLTWQSGPGIPYFLQRSTNLIAQPLSVLQTDIPGGSNTTTYTVTTATNFGPYFYSVGVK
jgi:hypothetical protein